MPKTTQLTVEMMKSAMPKQIRGGVTQSLVDKMIAISSDPIFAEEYRDNIIQYADILKGGKFKAASYYPAVQYVSYKIMGSTNINAYMKTFPERYNQFIANGTSPRDIASYVSSYNKNKLVNLIWEQSMIPVHVSNQHHMQDAINVQASIMHDMDNSAKVRSEAANSLMTHLKRPETQKIELDVAVKEDGTIRDLRATTMELVTQQRKMIAAGQLSAQDAAHSQITIEHVAED